MAQVEAAPIFLDVAVPAVRVDAAGPVQRLSWHGPAYDGEATRVEALFATPGSLSGDSARDASLPGVVLLHGGGGKAYPAWVRLWAEAGYAAVAPDMSGRHGGPPDSAGGRFARLAEPSAAHWNAHALHAARSAVAWLRARDDVRADAVAVVGTSWGGVHALRLAALDPELAAVVSVYGTGLNDRNGVIAAKLRVLPPDQAARWMALYDPAAPLATSAVPVLLASATDDANFPLDVLLGTHAARPEGTTLSVALHREHDHATAWGLPEVRRFVDARVGLGPPLMALGTPRVAGAELEVAVGGGPPVSAEVLEGRGPPGALVWSARPAELRASGRLLVAPAPGEDVRVWMVSAVDADGARVTSAAVGDPAAAAAR